MDWSGYGRWTGTHAARQAEPGHGTAVETAVLGSGTHTAGLGRVGPGCGYDGSGRQGTTAGASAGVHSWWLGGGGGGEEEKMK